MNNYKQHSGCSGKRASVFFGLLLTLIGTLLLASNMGWVDPSLRGLVFSWQIIFVIFTAISLINRNYFSTLVFLALSIFFFLPKVAAVYPETLSWVDSDFARNYWPLLIILVGIGTVFGIFFGKRKFLFIWKSGRKNTTFGSSKSVNGIDGIYNRSVFFGGAEDVFLEPVFRGGKIEVLFGGVELDLRKTTLPEGDTHLSFEVLFGGVELRIPDTWKVEQKIDAMFGGVEENQKRQSHTFEIDNSRRLIITGEVLFGGCEIRYYGNNQ
ncbi:MAG: cell wall-active antibiotics response protein [Dysgonamonadaceae bacterium]|jgi:predicted membrane protein|nr:cell wall-active antibiotics response protein [Dysgonamonadaceae bacterium]